jgi:hypothetical protein
MKVRLLFVVSYFVVPSVLLAQSGYLPLTGGTLSGPLTAPSVNAVLNAASCEDSTPPTWCSGSDIGRWVNAAIAECAPSQSLVGNCDIYIPPGKYSISTTINIDRVGVHLHGGGRGAVTELDYSGAGDVIVINPLLGSGSGGFNPVQGGPAVSDLRIVATVAASSAIHLINCNDCKVEDVEAWSAPCTGSGCTRPPFNAGFWLDDQSCGTNCGWSERNTFIRDYSYENRNGFLFTNNGGTGSFARTHCFSCFVNVGNSGTAITLGAAAVYDSFLDISGNLDSGTSGGVVLYVDPTSQLSFANEYNIKFENNQTSIATCISAPTAGAQIRGRGWIECTNSPSFPMKNSINPSAHFGLVGGRDPLQVEFSYGIVPWLVPQNVNAVEGMGFNLRWDQSNWQSNGDTVHNGAAFISDNNADGDIEIYAVPSTGGNNQTVAQSTFANDLVATFNSGGLSVRGAFSATGGKSFKIDHPLDPANKYLVHTSVESPDMMNMYNGTVTTDKRGFAEVVLPDYFEALNRDFRYQLTAIGQFAQAIVAKKIVNNRFVIRTNKPGVEVSWQVTGIRHDVYANAYRTPTEQSKPLSERGRYLQPELFGAPPEQVISYRASEPSKGASHADVAAVREVAGH